MNTLDATHGAGFRLILRPPDTERDGGIDADLFGPSGLLSDAEKPVRLIFRGDGEARTLEIAGAAAEEIGERVSEALGGGSEALSAFERLATTPVRLYQRAIEAAPPSDADLLDRLGRLGDALLVDLDFGPDPGDMAGVPAAFTYLGQFLVHEMTVWNPVGEKKPVAPFSIDSAIDLKTVFILPAGFPTVLPPHVEKVEGLPLGKTLADLGKGFPGSGPDDLPRLTDGCPLLFERRNDQNLAMSQTHVAITRFVQAALRRLMGEGEGEIAARRIVTRHVQSVVLQDYLARLVDPETVCDVMQNGRAWLIPANGPVPLHPFHVPPEVSGAVLRFGHAMVRDTYAPWNDVDPHNTVPLAFAPHLLAMSYAGGALTNGRLKQSWTADWRHFLGTDGSTPVHARKLGTTLSRELFCLPGYLFQPSDYDRGCSADEGWRINLARRTLMSGALLRLPSGQALASQVNAALALAGSPMRIPLLDPADIEIPGNPVATGIMLEGPAGSRFVDATPLWLYILRESAVIAHGNRLGPLGGRVLAETLSAAVEASGTGMIAGGKRMPFTSDPRLDPSHHHRYDYADLVRFAFAL